MHNDSHLFLYAASVHDRPERCNDKESDSQKALSRIVVLLEVNTGGTLKRRTAASVKSDQIVQTQLFRR